MWTDIKSGLAWLRMSLLWASIGFYFRLTFTIEHFMRCTQKPRRRRTRPRRATRLTHRHRPRPVG